MRLGLMWALGPDSRYADPLAKQGTLPEQLPVSAGQATSACLATPPLPRRTRGGVGPLSWNQERPAAPCRRVKNEISYAACVAASSAGSSLMPGPMVVLTVTPFR